MFCTQCGNQNPDGATNCSSCGAPLGNDAPNAGFDYNNQNSYYGYDNNQQYYAPVEQALPSKGLSITSMILGIVAITMVVTFCCCYFSFGTVPFIIGLAATITGGIARSKAKALGIKDKMANAGFICGIISVIICIVAIIALIALVAFGMTMPYMTETDSYYDYYYYCINNFLM